MDFFEQLAQRLLGLVARRDVAGRVLTTPTQAQLTLVLREAFFATLLTDEGRPSRFVLLFPPEQQAAASGRLELAPSPLTRASISRLAPCAPLERSVLVLNLSNGVVEISSMLTFGDDEPRPAGLAIAGHRPGVLSISFNHHKILHVSGDAVVAFDGERQYFDAEVGLFRLAMHQRDGSFQSRSLVASIVWQAVRLMRREGHGGSVWCMPADQAPHFEGELQRVSGQGELFRPVTQVLERTPPVLADGPPRSAEFSGVSHTVRQLAATDGAVLLSLAPHLIGFGAFVHTQPPDRVWFRRDGVTQTLLAAELGGGRHRSTAAFCAGGQPGERAAVIVSQDGAVTFFFNVRPEDEGLFALGAQPGVFAAQLEQLGRGFAADE